MRKTDNTVNDEFQIRSMSKKELAVLYAPGLATKSATNRLCLWLHTNPSLMEELRMTQYRETQHVLTSRQVEIIVRHLGEP